MNDGKFHPDKREPKKKRRPPDGVAQILKARRQIVLALIEQAKKGSYLHAKFLFDYARISQAEDPEAEREVSLAELLLTRLRQEEAAAGGESETPDPGEASVL